MLVKNINDPSREAQKETKKAFNARKKLEAAAAKEAEEAAKAADELATAAEADGADNAGELRTVAIEIGNAWADLNAIAEGE